MAKKSDGSEKKLNRRAHIEEEARRAAEHGVPFPDHVPLAVNFRSERSTPVLVRSLLLPDEAATAYNDSDVKIAVSPSRMTEVASSLREAFLFDAQASRRQGEAAIAALKERLRQGGAEQVLEDINRMTVAGAGPRQTAALLRKLSEVVFQGKEFKDIRGKPGGGMQSPGPEML